MSVTVVFNDFPRIAAELPAKVNAATEHTAQQIADTARSLAPVDTGALQGSISQRQIGPAHYEVVADIRYARYVEYGTAEHGGPQPFMTPAAHQAEQSFIAELEAAIVP